MARFDPSIQNYRELSKHFPSEGFSTRRALDEISRYVGIASRFMEIYDELRSRMGEPESDMQRGVLIQRAGEAYRKETVIKNEEWLKRNKIRKP